MIAPLARVAAALTLAGGAAVAAGCGSGDKSVDDAELPYSFTYPGDFNQAPQEGLGQTGGAFQNVSAIAKGDGAELVSVQTQPLRQAVTPKLVKQLEDQQEALARRDASVLSRKDVRIDDVEGVQFRVDLKEGGTTTSALWTYVAKGRTLYYVNCQWRQDRETVLDACAKVTDTLELK